MLSLATKNDRIRKDSGASAIDVEKFQHPGRHYASEFKIIAKALSPRRYFEIGTRGGQSLRQFECDAIAVDPRFHISADPILKRTRTLFFQLNSDDFFNKYSPSHLLDGPIDIAFLDGMHRYEYLLRDFINTEKHCRRNSVIMLHDCLPPHPYMARRPGSDDGKQIMSLLSDQGAQGLRNEAGELVPPEKLGWAGDVFRMLFILKQYRPELRIRYYDCPPTGLVLVSNLDPNSKVLEEAYFDAVDMAGAIKLSYPKLEELYNLYPMVQTKVAGYDHYTNTFTAFQ